MSEPLQTELNTYRDSLAELLDQEGKFVLICGKEVRGTFTSYEDALKAGYEKCGLGPFLVKKISADEPVGFFTRDLPNPCRT